MFLVGSLDLLVLLSGSFSSYFLVVDVLQCIGVSLIFLMGLHILFKKHSYIFSIVLFTIGCVCFVTAGSFSSYFLVVDVLQCIGVSLIFLVGLHILFKKHSYIFSIVLFTIGCVCFVTEPLYRNLTLDHVPQIIGNYLIKSNGSVFTILPWFGYSAFGAFISTVFFRHVHRDRFKLSTIIIFFIVGGFLIYYSSWFLLKLYDVTDIELFKMSANYNYLFSRLGDVLMLFGVFYTLEQFLKQSIIARIGEKTLSIYVIHFILLYGSFTGYGLKKFLSNSLEPTTAILGAVLFMVVVCFISFHYAKTNAFVYNLTRKIIDTFKNR